MTDKLRTCPKCFYNMLYKRRQKCPHCGEQLPLPRVKKTTQPTQQCAGLLKKE